MLTPKEKERKLMMQTIRVFREMPPWREMDRNEQTKALMKVLRENKTIMSAIRTLAKRTKT